MKKILLFCLAAIMLFAFAQTVALADEPQARTMIGYDGFENEKLGVMENMGGGISYRAESDVFGNAFYPQGATFEIVEDGYKGKAMKVTEDGGSPFQLGTELVTPTEDTPVYLNLKIKILEDMGTPNIAMKAGYSTFVIFRNEASYPAGPVIFMNARKGPYYYENNKWYDFTYKFMAGGRIEVTARDDEGNEFTGNLTGRSASDMYIFIRSSQYDTDAPAGTTILIDEISIFTLDPSVALDVDKTSLPEDVDNMHCKPEFDVVFNQPAYMNTMAVSVADEDGNTLSPADYTVVPTGVDSAKVTFDTFLNKDTTYTVTFSGLKTWADVYADDVSMEFTTEVAHMLAPADGTVEDVDGKAKVTVNFEDTLGYLTTPVKVMAVVYEDGKMTNLEYTDGAVDENGALTVEFDTIDADDDITILVFDESNSLIPVSEAICLK